MGKLKTLQGIDQLKFMLENHLVLTVHWDGLSILEQQVVVFHSDLFVSAMGTTYIFICMQIAYFKDSNCSVKGKLLMHAKRFAGVENGALLV